MIHQRINTTFPSIEFEYGVIMDIALGIIGAIVGGFIMRTLGFAGQGGMIYTIIIAVIGAVILIWIVHLVKKA
jgi:uncharacterized membrane protein YeaQ/YmgE (transglycosylase-associated protein family)